MHNTVTKDVQKLHIVCWNFQNFFHVYNCQKSLHMQPEGSKNLWFWILLACTSTNLIGLRVDVAQAANSEILACQKHSVSRIASLRVTSVTLKSCQNSQQLLADSLDSELHPIHLAQSSSPVVSPIYPEEPPPPPAPPTNPGQAPSVPPPRNLPNNPPPLEGQPNNFPGQIPSVPSAPANSGSPPSPPTNPGQIPSVPPPKNLPNNPPPLEGQPNNFPAPSPVQIEQHLEIPKVDYQQRLRKLLQLLQSNESATQQTDNGELGNIIVQEQPLEQLPPPHKREFKPIGYLEANVGYFQTSNVFSSAIDAKADELIFSGLTLTSVPLALGRKTYLTGSINGNLIRYVNQSTFNYEQLILNLNIYQQLTQQMYGEFGWSNQQLFYAENSRRYRFASGDRFDNENSLYLSFGRRDPLSSKLMLDSYYEFRLSLTNVPQNRNRLINTLWLSLNYFLKKSLQVGIDYQFNSSNFTQRDRFDQYHRIYSHLTYGISDLSSVGLQTGVTLGSSTDRTIDFNGWFFSVNYNWDLGRF